MLGINLLTAQSYKLIEYHEDLRHELSDGCKQKVDYWETIKSNDSIYFVTVMNIESAQEDGRIKFNLPGLTDTIYATSVSVREKTDSTIVWSGIIDCYEGNLLLISKDSTTIGYINYKGKTYTLRKLCGDYVVLIVHTDENTEYKCGNYTEAKTKSKDNGALELRHDNKPPLQYCCISTILVLYTDAAEEAADPESEAELLVENTNQALANSQVCHRVSLVGVEYIDWDESGNMFTDRQRKNVRDNARQIDNLGCTIAKYRSTNHYCEDFTVFVDGQSVIEGGNSYDWCANASGCGSNMTYIWEYSVDGFNWEVGGYDECMTLNVGIHHLHVRLKVICDNECFNVGYFFSINKNGLFDENCLEARFSSNSKKSLVSNILTLYPNPSSEIVNLSFDFTNSEDDNYVVRIHNAFGKSVDLGLFSKLNISNKSIDVSHYQDGIYFITIESENEYAISKFMVQH